MSRMAALAFTRKSDFDWTGYITAIRDVMVQNHGYTSAKAATALMSPEKSVKICWAAEVSGELATGDCPEIGTLAAGDARALMADVTAGGEPLPTPATLGRAARAMSTLVVGSNRRNSLKS